ncbi:MAG: methionyl-tRNA formyltransferase [Candidatus Baltobacteraceae bacterium]
MCSTSTRRKISGFRKIKKRKKRLKRPPLKRIRTLFFGTSAFAVPSLRVMARRTDLAGAVTQPDSRSGRGRQMHASPVKSAAVALGVPVYQPASLRAFANELQGTYDLFALASYGKILPQALLDVPAFGALNVHPSLLPRYRGATPIQSALLDDARETGVTIMLMDAGLDTGDIVLQEATPVEPQERYGELHDRLAQLGSQLLERALGAAQDGALPRHPQQGEGSLTHPFGKSDLILDWNWPVRRVVSAVRAFSPTPAARAQLRGEAVKLLRAQPFAGERFDAPPGSIVSAHGEAATVQCGDGAVDVLELVPANRRAMSGAAFLR